MEYKQTKDTKPRLSTFVDRIEDFVAEHHLLCIGKTQLVGVSGGADSVCLLLVLQQLGYAVHAVHCNFHLRGDESNRDEQFVKELCRDKDIPLSITHFDTNTYANLHQVSIEMAARELRYHYFEQLRRDLEAEAICVAHHSDDSVETVLMNLIRGTGIRGLSGIKPRNGHVVRPLLCVSRQDIETWLMAQGQDYVTDSTNLQADIIRNKLRLDIIPQLRQTVPAVKENILKTAQRMEEATRVYDHATQEALQRLVTDNVQGSKFNVQSSCVPAVASEQSSSATFNGQCSINITALLSEPSPESILYEWLSPLGFTPDTIERMAAQLETAQAGREWRSPTHQLTINRGHLVVEAIRPDLPTLRIPEAGTYVYHGDTRLHLEQRCGQQIIRDRQSACLDAANVRFPLTLRPIRQGDRFQPYGMKGTRLVSDYLTDRHLSVFEKRRTTVLCDSEGKIIWLVGHRPDGRYTVTDNTTNTLVCVMKE